MIDMSINTVFSRAEAARYLGLSVRTLDRYQREGLLKKCQAKQNGRVIYTDKDLRDFQNRIGKR